MHQLIKTVEETFIHSNLPAFKAGDNVKVHVAIKEADKERIQIFEGVVISRKGSGLRATFMVRKMSYGIGVERIFPLHSPNIRKIEVVRTGRVRRAKLFYLRKKRGKAARIKEKRAVLEQRSVAPQPDPQ